MSWTLFKTGLAALLVLVFIFSLFLFLSPGMMVEVFSMVFGRSSELGLGNFRTLGLLGSGFFGLILSCIALSEFVMVENVQNTH